jgi:hypothetical protein
MHWEASQAGFDPEFVAEIDAYLPNVPGNEGYYFDMEAMMSGE